jgi:hypothetical protein
MRSKIIWAIPVLLLSLLPNTLHAQARFAIYGTVGGETAGGPHESWDLAGTVGFYAGLKKLGPLDLSLDARADLSDNLNSGLLGPRVAFTLPAFPIKPYGEFLIGFTDYNKNASFADSTQFAARYVLGTDMTILPHVDWRIADFSYDLNNSPYNTHAKTLSTGLVIRF